MLTQCPECGTWFKVTEAHLALADGRVHCGQCNAVFDARAHLADARREPEPEEPEPIAALLTESLAAETAPAPATATHPADMPAAAAWHGAAWVAGCVFLTLTIGLQTLWWWRDDWAATPTGLRLVQTLCRIAPCQAQPPRVPERIEVLDRSLQPHPQRPGLLHFRLRLVNRAGHPQPYPLLELRLYDHLERLTAARRFTTDDYLPAAPVGALLEPDRPETLELDLADPGSHVTGFQIDFL